MQRGRLFFDGKHSKLRAVLSLCHNALFNSSYKYWLFMEVDESINNDESQQRNVYGSLIDGCTHHQMFVPSRRMSYILTYVRVALATSGVQSSLEIPATDEIHMEDRNHGHTTQNTVNRLARRQQHLNH